MWIKVKFSKDSNREYYYQSPFQIKRGQLVLVNVYGKLKVCEVIEVLTREPAFNGEIKRIVGLAYLNEDLDQPREVYEPSFMDRVAKSILG